MENTSDITLGQFWETRYADADQVWSGRVNQSLADVTSGLAAGRALDLGCGEGGDAIWLARQGWEVTGVDVSSTAIARAKKTAAENAADGRIRWIVHDLAGWNGDGSYDLVYACFFHSPVDIPRSDILSRAAGLVAPRGRLLIVSHGDFPPWAAGDDRPEYRFLTPAEEIDELDIDTADWEVQIAETRSRAATGPDGENAMLDDAVVVLRRR